MFFTLNRFFLLSTRRHPAQPVSCFTMVPRSRCQRVCAFQRFQETCQARQNVRCQGCGAECFTLKPSNLVSVNATHVKGKVAVCQGVKNLSPDIFGVFFTYMKPFFLPVESYSITWGRRDTSPVATKMGLMCRTHTRIWAMWRAIPH